MNIVMKIIVVLLVLLSIASGVAKVMLVPQEVLFFEKYGFSEGLLIVFGAVQLIGGLMIGLPKTRKSGAYIVLSTFVMSLIILLLNANYLMSAITVIPMILLGIIIGDKNIGDKKMPDDISHRAN